MEAPPSNGTKDRDPHIHRLFLHMKARFEEEFSLLNDAEDWETAVTLRVTTQATDALFEVQRLISGAKVLTNEPYTGMDTSRCFSVYPFSVLA